MAGYRRYCSEFYTGRTNLITLRPLRWPDDRASLLALDTSFTTDRLFRLERTDDQGVTLVEVAAEPPLQKSYLLAKDVDLLNGQDWVQIAEHDQKLVAVAAVTIEAWNRRAVLNHLYVTAAARGMGIGQALVTAAFEFARDRDARCLWVETQTVNYGAVRFYQRMGFKWCGFDASLYDTNEVDVGEVALFFSRAMRKADLLDH
jgi:ribosomal protein S18 acetylase RimI-like enzyme